MSAAHETDVTAAAFAGLVGEGEPSVRMIAEASAEFYGVRYREILSGRRNQRLVRARHVAMYLARTLTGRSLPEVGRALGKDHTTVMHGMRSVDRMLVSDPALADEVGEIRTAVVAASAALARAALRVPVTQPVDLDPVKIAQRVLDEVNGLTSISMEELTALSAAVASGAETADLAAEDAARREAAAAAPAAPPPTLNTAIVAAGRELIAALAAVDNSSFEDRGTVAAARVRLRAARASFERWLNTVPGAAGSSTKETDDAEAQTA